MARRMWIDLPEELNAALIREASRRGISEAEVIRQAVAAALPPPRPRPRAGFLDGPPIAEEAEQLLEFGER